VDGGTPLNTFINFLGSYSLISFPYHHATSHLLAQYIIFITLYYESDRLSYKLGQKVPTFY